MKTIVIYYSLDKQTETLAKKIAQEHQADIFKIKALEPYPIGHHQLCQRVLRELEIGARPKFTESICLDKYDTVFIGSPIWLYHLPCVVTHFLECHSFINKRIIPFTTCLYKGERESIIEILEYTKQLKKGEEKDLINIHPIPHNSEGYWYIGE